MVYRPTLAMQCVENGYTYKPQLQWIQPSFSTNVLHVAVCLGTFDYYLLLRPPSMKNHLGSTNLLLRIHFATASPGAPSFPAPNPSPRINLAILQGPISHPPRPILSTTTYFRLHLGPLPTYSIGLTLIPKRDT